MASPVLLALALLASIASAADMGAAADGEDYAYDDELCDRHGFGPAQGPHVYEYCKYNFGERGSLHHEEYLAGKRGCTWARETRLTLELTYENIEERYLDGSPELSETRRRRWRQAGIAGGRREVLEAVVGSFPRETTSTITALDTR